MESYLREKKEAILEDRKQEALVGPKIFLNEDKDDD